MTDIKKRFIAGAVCPRCGLMDKIVTFKQDSKEYRECVSCGFEDVMNFKPAVRELETRVSKSEEEKRAEAQVIKFVTPSKGGKGA